MMPRSMSSKAIRWPNLTFDSIDRLFTFRSHLGNADGPPCGQDTTPGVTPPGFSSSSSFTGPRLSPAGVSWRPAARTSAADLPDHWATYPVKS